MKTKIVIFGVSGDLCKRKILPALNKIVSNEKLGICKIIGVSRREIEKETIFKSLNLQGKNLIYNKFSMFKVDNSSINDYLALKKQINLKDDEKLLIYLSVPPSNIKEYCEFLGKVKLNLKNIKLIIEKPFGYDLSSATDLLNSIGNYFDEENVVKVDHYMLKKLLQRMVKFRKHNKIIKKIWNGEYIKKIYIECGEKIDIEGRGQFYEQTGCLRDFVQNHMMQILLLTICKNNSFESRKKVIDSFKELNYNDVNKNKIIRGQYIGYKQEVNNDNSSIETFVAVKLLSNLKKWRNVDFVLASGKALSKKTAKIVVFLRNGENIEFSIANNIFPKTIKIKNKKYLLNAPQESKIPDAYEGIFTAIILDKTKLFPSDDEIIGSWKIYQKIVKKWRNNSDGMIYYKKGEEIKNLLNSFN